MTTTATAIRQRNVVPFADLSTMPAREITELMHRAAYREAHESQDRALWASVGNDERAARAGAMRDFWDATAYAAMFTIEDRLEASA
ncbi:hypothetical protein GCM10027053_05380 [Intrasporangium mesophilum]